MVLSLFINSITFIGANNNVMAAQGTVVEDKECEIYQLLTIFTKFLKGHGNAILHL